MVGNRRQSREVALSYLYQNELKVNSRTEIPAAFIRHFSVPEAFQAFFLKLVEGVAAHHEEIDREIEAAAEHWKLYRMSKIDLSILRMACFELMFTPETTHNIILDEAVELAKDYGSQDSASFVNGLLDRIAKKVRGLDPELSKAV